MHRKRCQGGSAMKTRITLAVVAIVGLVAAVGVLSLTPERPSRVSIGIESHGSVLAVMRGSVNGSLIVMSSLRGRTESRSPNYANRFDTTLSVQVMWYDITEERYYHRYFKLDARDFSTFDAEGERAQIYITLGPGADITVTTPHPEALLLVGLNRIDDITPEIADDVVLAAFCASVAVDDPSENKGLRAAMLDEVGIESAIFNRENWLSQSTAPLPRCAT